MTPEELQAVEEFVRGGEAGAAIRQQIADDLDTTREWVDPNGYRLSDRLWRAGETDRAAIEQVLRQSLAAGEDAMQTARRLEAYLLDDATSLIVQQQTGIRLPRPFDRPSVTTRMPRSGRGNYAARRLARTEVVRAHGDATMRAAMRNPLVEGIRWRLSNRHPLTDICDERANEDHAGLGPGVYAKGDVDQYPAHPNCLCTLSPVVSRDRADQAFASVLQRIDERKVASIATAEAQRLAAEALARATEDARTGAAIAIRRTTARLLRDEAERAYLAQARQLANTGAKSGGLAEQQWRDVWDYGLKGAARIDAYDSANAAAQQAVTGMTDVAAARAAAQQAAQRAALDAASRRAGEAAARFSEDTLAGSLESYVEQHMSQAALPNAARAMVEVESRKSSRALSRRLFQDAAQDREVGAAIADDVMATMFDDIVREEWDRAYREVIAEAARAEAADAATYVRTVKATKRAADVAGEVVQQAVDAAVQPIEDALRKKAAAAARRRKKTPGNVAYGDVRTRLQATGYDPYWDKYDPLRDAFETTWNDAQTRQDDPIFRKLPRVQQQAVKCYKDQGYAKINRVLRGNSGISLDDKVGDHISTYTLNGYPSDRTFRDIANDIDAAVSASTSTQDAVIFRGVSSQTVADAYASYVPGDIVVENGFFSAATAQRKSWGGAIEWEIYVPQGAPGMQIDVTGINDTEREFLTPEGMTYKIISNTVFKNTRKIVAEMLPSPRRTR